MSAAGKAIPIALIGDHDPKVLAHRAIPLALDLAADEAKTPIRYEWVHTTQLDANPHATLHNYRGIWCVPGSPYANAEGALGAIRFAREHRRPFLGTCGGFQHALLEFAKNVLKIPDPRHAETDPDAPNPLIVLLACSLVEASETISLAPHSRIARAYARTQILEDYHCRYGLSREFKSQFAHSALRPVGWDAQGEVRAVELDAHPFFVATLFQPERAALRNTLPPLVRAFVRAAIDATLRGN